MSLRPLLGHLLSVRNLVWLALIAALAGLLCFVPLFDRLAYPFCLALALPTSLAAAHLGSALVARTRRGDEGLLLATERPATALLVLLARAILVAWSSLALPLLFIGLNALRVRNCDPLAGLAFFALIPLLSALLAAALGTFCGLLLPRPALATALAWACIFGSIGWSLYRLYVTPAIFAFDPFVGYFPGAIYDEAIAVRATFLLYRLHNLLWFAGAVLGAMVLFDPGRVALRRWHRQPRLTAAALICLSGAATLFALGDRLGFVSDLSAIRRALGGLRHTTHFDIYHPEDLAVQRVDELVEDHEFRYAQLAALLGTRPARLRSFVFDSAEQKQRLMGARSVLIAKPWRGEVYLQLGPFPLRSLKHELAHVFAANFGDDLLGVSVRWERAAGFVPYPLVNMGLIEGLAVAADWRPRGDGTVHEQAAALEHLGLAPPLSKVFGPAFLGQAGHRAYTVAGSFFRYLWRRHGRERLQALYRSGGDFQGILGQPLAELDQRWRRWLRRLPLPPRTRQLAEETYRRPSIFRRACPHAIANLRQRADDLRRRGDRIAAAETLKRICQLDDDPGHLLQWFDALVAAGLDDRALAIARRIRAHRATSRPLLRQLTERLGDLRWLQDDQARAAGHYRRAADFAGEAPQRRALFFKRWALRRGGPASELVRDYLLDRDDLVRSPTLQVHLAHRLAEMVPEMGAYLAAKQLAAHDNCSRAAAMMARALRRGLPDEDLTVEALRVLGICHYRSGRRAQAAIAFDRLKRRAGREHFGRALEAEDWLQRIHWRSTGDLPGKKGVNVAP